MTDANTTPAATPAEKIKTVLDDMEQRRVFDSTDEATAYIEKCQTDFADFGGYPVAAVGLTDEGEFDPEVYTDEMRVAVSVLSQRANSAMNPTNASRVHCIVIYPMPRLSAILGIEESEVANAGGLAWLQSVMETELNHVAVRSLRKAEDAEAIAEAVDSMPTTVADYITSGRESSSGILETYNALWQVVKKAIGSISKPFALRNFSKKELRKAMESASYAAAVYPNIEERKNAKGEDESLFVVAANFGLMVAKQESLDPTIFERMLAQRDEKEIAVAEDDEAEFDLAAMAATLAKKADAPAPTEAPAELAADAATSDDAEATGE